jgi:predicted O-methyltransferase YrrM
MKKLIKYMLKNSPPLNRKYLNFKNYFSTRNKLKKSSGQMKDNQLNNKLFELITNNEVKNIVEIGTWNGLGSTTMLLNIIVESDKNINFYSIE